MNSQKFTQEDRKKALQNKVSEMQLKFELEEKIIEKIDFEFFVFNPRWVKIKCKQGNYINKNGIDSKEDLLKCLEAFPAGKKKQEIKTSLYSILTKGSYVLKINNHINLPLDMKLVYETEDGIVFWIELMPNMLNLKGTHKLVNPISKAINPLMFTEYTLEHNNTLERVTFTTATEAKHYCYHGKNKDILNLFK